MFAYIAVDVERTMRAAWGWEIRESWCPEWVPEPGRDDDDDEPERPGGLTIARSTLVRLAGAARRVIPARVRPAPS